MKRRRRTQKRNENKPRKMAGNHGRMGSVRMLESVKKSVRKQAEPVEAVKKSELEASSIKESVSPEAMGSAKIRMLESFKKPAVKESVRIPVEPATKGRVQILEHGQGAQSKSVKKSVAFRMQGDTEKTKLESVR